MQQLGDGVLVDAHGQGTGHAGLVVRFGFAGLFGFAQHGDFEFLLGQGMHRFVKQIIQRLLLGLQLLLVLLLVGRVQLFQFVEIRFAGTKQVMGDGVHFRIGKRLLILRQSVGIVVGQAVEVGHLGVGAEVARPLQPFQGPLPVRLLGQAIKAGADLALVAGQVVRVGQPVVPFPG